MQQDNVSPIDAALVPSLKVRPDMEEKWLVFGKDGLPFDQGVEKLLEAHRIDGGTITDIEIDDLRRLVFAQSGNDLVAGDTATRKVFKIRKAAWGGLMNHMGLGAGATDMLLDRFPPPFQTAALNVMMRRISKKLPAQLRVRGEDVLAIVSKKYAALDTPDLVDIARDALIKQGLHSQAMVRSVAYGGRDVIRVTFPQKDGEVKAGDIVSRGVDFRNGSWGGSAISLTTSLIRLVCLNGMVRDEDGKTGFHFRHVSTSNKVRARVEAALPQAIAGGEEVLARFHESLNVEVDSIGKMFSFLPDDVQVGEKEKIREQLKEELGVPVLNPRDHFSLFHGINAITAVARDLSTERRLLLETAAGDLLFRD